MRKDISEKIVCLCFINKTKNGAIRITSFKALSGQNFIFFLMVFSKELMLFVIKVG